MLTVYRLYINKLKLWWFNCFAVETDPADNTDYFPHELISQYPYHKVNSHERK